MWWWLAVANVVVLVSACETWCNEWTCTQKEQQTGVRPCADCSGCPALTEADLMEDSELAAAALELIPEGQWGNWDSRCVGPIVVEGIDDPIYAVLTPGNNARAKASRTGLMLSHNVRLYLATRCSLSPSAYVAWSLPGYTLQFDLDLDGAGCGCNVAPYLVSMAQNNQPGSCSGDHYCECGDETQTRASSALDGRATQRACSLSLRRCSLQPALITARATWTLTAAQRERGVWRALCGNRRGRGQHARLPRDCAHVQ